MPTKAEPKVWLKKQWETLIPALEQLGLDQEEEIERLCLGAIAYWKDERHLSLSSMNVPMTDTRNRIKEILLTPTTRWKNPKTSEVEHIALKYMNFSEEEWTTINTRTKEKVQDQQEDQQFIENPAAIVAKAEALLSSDRWYDLTAGLALVTGRRLTEVLKTARFFPKSLYSVTFDGQLKKREDVNLLPYEIPTLVRAELVITAWRRLRSLVDCTQLDNRQVSEKYHKDVSRAADMHFAGLIPQKSEKDNLTTKAFRAVYAHIAVLWFCPLSTPDGSYTNVSDRSYANAILGHWQAKDEKTKRHFLATEHYFGYVMSLDGQVDGRRGIRLQEPSVQALEVFKRKEGVMTTTNELTQGEETQGNEPVFETKTAKRRGTLTTKAGTFDIIIKLMRERGYHHHDEILVDLLKNDNIALQLIPLLEPLQERLSTVGPISTLQTLVVAYETLRLAEGQLPSGMGEILHQLASEDLETKITDDQGNDHKIRSQENPVGYLQALVDHNRRFKAALKQRDDETAIDYTRLTWAELNDKKVSTRPGAATERYRRAVNAIMAHNSETEDPLHQWFINSAIIRDLVGGRNEKVQTYLKTRTEEIKVHHLSFNPPLTIKTNNKNIPITQEKGIVARLEADPVPSDTLNEETPTAVAATGE